MSEDAGKQLDRLTNIARTLAEQIKQAQRGEDEIDKAYLLDAVERDLIALSNGKSIHNVAELLVNPAS